MAMDSVACPVNLSGEWADGPTVEDVAGLYSRRPSPDALDDLCTDWEDGAQDGWMGAITTHLRSLAQTAQVSK